MAKKKKPVQKPSKPAKKPAVKKAPAKKTVKPAPKTAKKQAEKKPVPAPVPKVVPKPVLPVPQRREPSMFRRAADNRQDPEEKKGIDRSRLGALQAKIFRPGAIDPEKRQVLAHHVSEIATSVNKPRIVKQQVMEDLKKLAKQIKGSVGDAALRDAMLADVEAFGIVVQTPIKQQPVK